MTAISPVHQALCEALDDEYKARALYAAAINKFGPVPPFINIIQSEQRHVDALLGIFASRGWVADQDPYLGKLTVPDTFVETCRAGVQAEIDNVALYERLNALAEGDAEVLAVFGNLQRASQENHLPAFERGAMGNFGGDDADGHRCCGGGHGRGRHNGAHAGGGRCCGA